MIKSLNAVLHKKYYVKDKRTGQRVFDHEEVFPIKITHFSRYESDVEFYGESTGNKIPFDKNIFKVWSAPFLSNLNWEDAEHLLSVEKGDTIDIEGRNGEKFSGVALKKGYIKTGFRGRRCSQAIFEEEEK